LDVYHVIPTPMTFVVQVPIHEEIYLKASDLPEGKSAQSLEVILKSDVTHSLGDLRSALFWDVMWRRVVIVYRCFGTMIRSHLDP
jgi:hypothetical protein